MSDQASKRPALELFAVTKSKNGEGKGFWQKIGAAWPHEDGKGFSLKMELMPMAGQDLVLREPMPSTQTAQDQAA